MKKQKGAEAFKSVQDMEISQEEEIRVVKRRWSARKFCVFCHALSIARMALDYIGPAWPRGNNRLRKKHDNSQR